MFSHCGGQPRFFPPCHVRGGPPLWTGREQQGCMSGSCRGEADGDQVGIQWREVAAEP